MTALLFALSAFARDHKDLNGTWTLIPAKSEFAGQPVLQTGTVTISDHEGTIVISRRFKYEGTDETFFYNDDIGTQNHATIKTSKDLKTKTKWEDNVLKVMTTESGATTVESYALAADGTMTVNVERPGHKLITLVFQHQ